MDVSGKRVVVTGFLGQAVRQALELLHFAAVIVIRRKRYDLRNEAANRRLSRDSRPDVVVHLAAVVGGFEANRKNLARYFYDNAIMGTRLLEQARRCSMDKFVAVGTICSYPKFTQVPFREEDLWNG